MMATTSKVETLLIAQLPLPTRAPLAWADFIIHFPQRHQEHLLQSEMV